MRKDPVFTEIPKRFNPRSESIHVQILTTEPRVDDVLNNYIKYQYIVQSKEAFPRRTISEPIAYELARVVETTTGATICLINCITHPIFSLRLAPTQTNLAESTNIGHEVRLALDGAWTISNPTVSWNSLFTIAYIDMQWQGFPLKHIEYHYAVFSTIPSGYENIEPSTETLNSVLKPLSLSICPHCDETNLDEKSNMIPKLPTPNFAAKNFVYLIGPVKMLGNDYINSVLKFAWEKAYVGKTGGEEESVVAELCKSAGLAVPRECDINVETRAANMLIGDFGTVVWKVEYKVKLPPFLISGLTFLSSRSTPTPTSHPPHPPSSPNPSLPPTYTTRSKTSP